MVCCMSICFFPSLLLFFLKFSYATVRDTSLTLENGVVDGTRQKKSVNVWGGGCELRAQILPTN